MTTRELRELLARATPGPWRPGRSDMTTLSSDDASPFYKNVYADDPRGGEHLGRRLPFIVGRGQGDEAECIANAALIAALRNEAPALLDRVEALERALQEVCDHWDGYDDSEWGPEDRKGVAILKRARAVLRDGEGTR